MLIPAPLHPDPATTAFLTGHRNLSGSDLNQLPEMIRSQLYIAYESGYRCFFNGCALGFDTLAALEIIRFRESFPAVSLFLAIPCASQAEKWSEADRMIYSRIIASADQKVILSPLYYRGCMLTRNRFMADRSSLCICYMRSFHGGTASAVRYAASLGMPVINLAVGMQDSSLVLKENTWSCTFISRSAEKNAVTVPLRLTPDRKLTQKHISI